MGTSSISRLAPSQAVTLSSDILQVNKRMFQPIKAYISIEDIDPNLYLTDLTVQLAPAVVFEKMHVDRRFFVTKLDFLVTEHQGQWVIEVSSFELVKEPYLRFIVELSTPSKQLYREYTLLFDSPLTTVSSLSPKP